MAAQLVTIFRVFASRPEEDGRTGVPLFAPYSVFISDAGEVRQDDRSTRHLMNAFPGYQTALSCRGSDVFSLRNEYGLYQEDYLKVLS